MAPADRFPRAETALDALGGAWANFVAGDWPDSAIQRLLADLQDDHTSRFNRRT